MIKCVENINNGKHLFLLKAKTEVLKRWKIPDILK